MARILVGFPNKSTIDAETAVAAANIERCGHELTFAYADGRGVYGAAQARNRLAQKAIEGNYDYLLSIDADTIVPPDTLRLLLDPPAPIVLGVYRYKTDESGDAPFFKLNGTPGHDKWKYAKMPEGRFEVKAAGLGCSLIDVSVFKHLGLPYYHWDETPSGHHTGEDIWFCEKVRKAGYTIVADGRVKCGHAGRKVYK